MRGETVVGESEHFHFVVCRATVICQNRFVKDCGTYVEFHLLKLLSLSSKRGFEYCLNMDNEFLFCKKQRFSCNMNALHCFSLCVYVPMMFYYVASHYCTSKVTQLVIKDKGAWLVKTREFVESSWGIHAYHSIPENSLYSMGDFLEVDGSGRNGPF